MNIYFAGMFNDIYTGGQQQMQSYPSRKYSHLRYVIHLHFFVIYYLI